KNRQIGIGEARAPLAGSIAGSENSHNPRHGQSRRSIDPQDLSSRIAAEHHRSMQHPRHTHVIYERLVAQSLLDTVVARRWYPHAVFLAIPVCKRRVPRQPELFAEIEMASRFRSWRSEEHTSELQSREN